MHVHFRLIFSCHLSTIWIMDVDDDDDDVANSQGLKNVNHVV